MFSLVVFIFCVFKSVEPCLDQYSQLTNGSNVVEISGNVLEIPSQYYANCSSVTVINLNAIGSEVKLNSLDFVKYVQPSVKTLDASNNKIVKLPRLVNAVYLQTIRLINNQINDITYINEYRYLELIDFSENKIKDLPEITLTNLKTLMLRKNLIKSVKPWNLRASPNLITLQLDDNLLIELRMCEFKNRISVSVIKNPNFSCTNVLCIVCVCKDMYQSITHQREIDACPENLEIYFIAAAVSVIVLFSVIALTCIIRWKRSINRRIQQESQERNLLSMDSLPMTPVTPPPKYEFRNNQNDQAVNEIGHENPLGNIQNYDYVYDHFRKKRHARPHQQNSPW